MSALFQIADSRSTPNEIVDALVSAVDVKRLRGLEMNTVFEDEDRPRHLYVFGVDYDCELYIAAITLTFGEDQEFQNRLSSAHEDAFHELFVSLWEYVTEKPYKDVNVH
jgi:hypothetical protein